MLNLSSLIKILICGINDINKFILSHYLFKCSLFNISEISYVY